MLSNADIVTPNESELRVLLGLSPDDAANDEDLARQLALRGRNTVIVTQGEKGALIVNENSALHVPTINVEVIDSTGAGDAFSAAIAVALGEGRPLLHAVQWANCAGAMACTKLGSIPAYAQRETIDQLWKKHYG